VQLVQAILYVDDVERMRDFYVDLFDLRVILQEPGWIRLDSGGSVLALHALRRPDGAPPPASPPAPRTDSPIKLCFRVDDVDDARARLVAAGVAMRDIHRYDAVTFCDGIDPEGNVFQLTTY
jgi:catechol 2,3-dioxygenase-like lactoylglutathione lyase family enzyme